MDTKAALAHLHLNDKESALYVLLLEFGETPATPLIKHSGYKRPTVYAVLHALERKGFVTQTTKGKHTFFAAQHPRKIISEAELRLRELQEIVPQLEQIVARSDKRPRLVTYEGREALDHAFDDAFVHKGEILFMSNIALVQDALARTLAKWNYVTFSPDFRMREILDDSETSRMYAERVAGTHHEIRILPKEFSPFATDIGIYGDTTLITSGTREYFTVKIESEEIAASFRALFEMAWRSACEL